MPKTHPDHTNTDESTTPTIVERFSMALVNGALAAPKRVIALVLAGTVVMAGLFVFVQIDTDPENMLASDAPVRVRNAELRATFGTNEMLVVGLFSDTSLVTAEHLDEAIALHDALAQVDGVEAATMISVRSAVPGAPPASDAEAAALAAQIAADPLLAGNVLSADGDTLAFFVPLESKSAAQTVRDAANELVDASPSLAGLERHIAGLPLAQEAFGDQMFVQMAVFAPLAGLAIFGLMLLFFRRLALVVPAMALALVSVVWAMGLLIGTGNELHIMSSMIPIFLMPIAILDAIHVISEFFDRRGHGIARDDVIREVYAELSGPVAFTTVTTVVGFSSLALTPIPPVRVFGLFIAVGVLIAWVMTLTLLPALLMRGAAAPAHDAPAFDPEASDRHVYEPVRATGAFAAVVRKLPLGASRSRWLTIGVAIVAAAVAVPLAAGIEVNDNPVNWFRADHEVRVATERLNDELPGTFGANVVLTANSAEALTSADTIAAVAELQALWSGEPEIGTSASYVDLLGGATGAEARDLLDAAAEQSALVGTLIDSTGTIANLRMQLRSGDNQTMSHVVGITDAYLAASPLPDGVEAQWAGETYLNLVWQDEMVSGMLVGFTTTLVIITLLLVALFRSIKWALIGIAPVLWTILVVYGVIGLIGKDFDMPIAVLSTLVLGIGVDFAIHFVERFRHLLHEFGDRREALAAFAEEPARALSRNAAVVAVGFMPLLLSSLTPYVIVGFFLSSIIVLGWLGTVVILPAVVVGAKPQPSID